MPVAIFTIFLAACGGGGDNAPPPVTYSISGTVTGPWVEGVTITASGAANASATTDASGNYTIANLPAGTYTVTPSLAGYTYSPPASAVAVIANATQDFAASSVIPSYSVSGTVTYAGTKTGPVYLLASLPGTPGTRIGLVSGSGSYTIRGLQAGYFSVSAEMDTLGTGKSNVTNPAGTSSLGHIAAGDLSGINIVLTDPVPAVPATPTGLAVVPSGGAASITWIPTKNGGGKETATSYKIYWGTDAAATNGTPIIVPARDDGSFIQGGLPNGARLYYKISALAGAAESAASQVFGPIDIRAGTGLNTVSGTVSFTGTMTGPLIVALYGDKGMYFTRIANPADGHAYSISGIPDGSYIIVGAIDMNNNGVIDTGDMYSAYGFGSGSSSGAGPITVAGTPVTRNLSLDPARASAQIMSMTYNYPAFSTGYALSLGIMDFTRHAEAVTLVSGPNVAVPFDIGNDGGFGSYRVLNNAPSVGDRYGFKVSFSDGTSQNISGSVTGLVSRP